MLLVWGVIFWFRVSVYAVFAGGLVLSAIAGTVDFGFWVGGLAVSLLGCLGFVVCTSLGSSIELL